ncbi:MAG: flavin reductase [Candidatus Cloacimonetes bacterium]|nr:flavin reductase [Candidatus Cloacimonadota bacterium]
MHNTRRINNDVFWIGANDKRLALFESAYPLPKGVSYNSYLILDEKTILLDCVDKSVSGVFFENLSYLLKDRKLDFVVINHVEPDHCATLGELVFRYPEVKIIGNKKTFTMLKQYFDFNLDQREILVKEGDEFNTGRHKFVFVTAAMVHWPEVMVTYDVTDKYLYSADAFGTFGTLNGNIFADEVDFEYDFLEEARRYYTNIVGKYGQQVQAILKKASTLDISMILPLHGPIWRKNIAWFFEKYQKWSSYLPEEYGVLIAYSSVYGNTENAVNILATKLAEAGIKKIAMYDVSVTHHSYVVSEAFRFSHLVFASTTYNAGIFVSMEALLHDIAAHNLQNRTIAFIENGSWASLSKKLMNELLAPLKNMTFIEKSVSLKSSMKQNNLIEIDDLAQAIVESLSTNNIDNTLKDRNITQNEDKIETNAFFKITYGLFVLTAAKNDDHSGCIINTAMQITDNPKQLTIAINKANYTHDIVAETKKLNVSALSTSSGFEIFQRFGFQSSREVNKFIDFQEFCKKSENGLFYITKDTNAFFSAEIISSVDYGTHTLFVAQVTEAMVLSNEPSLSYQYYFDHIKPKPVIPQSNSGKKTYVCKICGYIQEYDGELPDDYICPLCKHPKSDMELIN